MRLEGVGSRLDRGSASGLSWVGSNIFQYISSCLCLCAYVSVPSGLNCELFTLFTHKVMASWQTSFLNIYSNSPALLQIKLFLAPKIWNLVGYKIAVWCWWSFKQTHFLEHFSIGCLTCRNCTVDTLRLVDGVYSSFCSLFCTSRCCLR